LKQQLPGRRFARNLVDRRACASSKLPLPGEVTQNFPLFLFAGMLPWLLFSETLQRSSTSLIDQSTLITKNRVPIGNGAHRDLSFFAGESSDRRRMCKYSRSPLVNGQAKRPAPPPVRGRWG
jgi:hypothetical protein